MKNQAMIGYEGCELSDNNFWMGCVVNHRLTDAGQACNSRRDGSFAANKGAKHFFDSTVYKSCGSDFDYRILIRKSGCFNIDRYEP
jgi:hypothetical protein